MYCVRVCGDGGWERGDRVIRGIWGRGKEENKEQNGQKNILDDLQGVKRRKIQEKMAKYPTGVLTRGGEKQIKSKNGKKNLLEDL